MKTTTYIVREKGDPWENLRVSLVSDKPFRRGKYLCYKCRLTLAEYFFTDYNRTAVRVFRSLDLELIDAPQPCPKS